MNCEARSGREVFKGKIICSPSFLPSVPPAAEVAGCPPLPPRARHGKGSDALPQFPPQLTPPGDCGARCPAARPAVPFRPGSRAKGGPRSRPPGFAGAQRLPDPRAAPLRPPGLASRGTGGELRAAPSGRQGRGWQGRAASGGGDGRVPAEQRCRGKKPPITL